MRRKQQHDPNSWHRFQSTHPLRDATMQTLEQYRYITDISIHAPLTGCDGCGITLNYRYNISIHAPLTGCDDLGFTILITEAHISIHAPLTGCDKNVRKNRQSEKNFNPRTPYGMRHNYIFEKINERYFNPRTPYGMRQYQRSHLSVRTVISIHAPLTGCDIKLD